MITDSELREIYSSAPVSMCEFEVITINAPWFTQPYYLQNIDPEGVSVVLETGETVIAEYAPMSIGQANSNADMSYNRTVVIQQLNDKIASEIEARNPELGQKVSLESRGYVKYRNGSVSQLKTTVIRTELVKVTRNNIGSTFDTSVRPINNTTTGEVATTSRVPMLKGFS